MSESPHLKPRLSRLYATLAGLALVLLALGAGELICRLLDAAPDPDEEFSFYVTQVDDDVRLPFMAEDPQTLWSPRPGYRDGLIAINQHGLRDRPFSAEKPPGTFRILCMGDSVTFARRNRLGDTYPKVLQRLLNNDKTLKSLKYQVINAGVTGYSSTLGLRLFVGRTARFQPDLVLFYYGLSDTSHSFALSDSEILRRHHFPGVQRVLLHSALFRTARQAAFSGPKAKELARSDPASMTPVFRVSEAEYAENIRTFNETCRIIGCRLALVVPALNNGWPWDRMQHAVRYAAVQRRTARELRLPLLSEPQLARDFPQPNAHYFHPNDTVHLNPEGHRLLAQQLHRKLRDHGLVPLAVAGAGGQSVSGP